MLNKNRTLNQQKIFEDYLITKRMQTTADNFGITKQRVQYIVSLFNYKKPNKYKLSNEEKAMIKRIKKIKSFWDNVAIKGENDCWLWTRNKLPRGYGKVDSKFYDKKEYYAHRLAWIITYGEIPNGLDILHKCDNPPCCNPKHLYLGTDIENARDRQERFYKNGKVPLHKKDR